MSMNWFRNSAGQPVWIQNMNQPTLLDHGQLGILRHQVPGKVIKTSHKNAPLMVLYHPLPQCVQLGHIFSGSFWTNWVPPEKNISVLSTAFVFCLQQKFLSKTKNVIKLSETRSFFVISMDPFIGY